MEELKSWFKSLHLDPQTLHPVDITTPGCVVIESLDPLKNCVKISTELNSLINYVDYREPRSVVLGLKQYYLGLVLFGVKTVLGKTVLITSAGDINYEDLLKIIELPWNFDYFSYYI